MRAVAPETASQVALRNCSKEVGRKVSIHVIFGEGGIRAIKPFFFFFFCRRFLLLMRRLITMKEFSSFLDMRRYKSWAHKIGSWKDLTIRRPVLPVFPRAQSTSFVLSHLNSFQGVLKVSSCSNVC